MTERLFLRPHFPEDWEAVYLGIGEEAIVRNLASAPWPYAPEDAQNFTKLPQDARSPRFAITLRHMPGAPLIGCIGLDRDQSEPAEAIEMGYWIARKHWGHGYASEAGQGVVQIADMLGYRRIVASHFTDNPASGRVLCKIGFKPTGVIKPQTSLGRTGKAPTAEYALDVAGDVGGDQDCDVELEKRAA